jgi:MerR family transcriptional regulator/heat shock protein HspR
LPYKLEKKVRIAMSIVRWYYHNDDEEVLPLCELDLHPELLRILEELGVVEIREQTIRPRQMQRVYRMLRLRQTMGVNLSGAAVILDLLERIEALEAEVDRLKK